ncbi:MAG: hypothetical protein H0W83_17630 [Planctomycetes bacterium]|nr:hypothetical protein [Planctomycetota bacterium]
MATVWNETCPVCHQSIPAEMPLMELSARADAGHVRFRVCGLACAGIAAKDPDRTFTAASESSPPESHRPTSSQRASSFPLKQMHDQS